MPKEGPGGPLQGEKPRKIPGDPGPRGPMGGTRRAHKGPELLCWFLQPLGPGPKAREGQGGNKEGPEMPRMGPERAQGEPRGEKGPMPVDALEPRNQ